MFLSLFLILTGGLIGGWICKKVKLPALLGMLLAGILLSPHCLNLIDPSLLQISSDIRQTALIIILIRAGLDLDINDLRKVGRPAILMCFLPATMEIIGCMLLGPALLHLSLPESLLLGAVLGAVSPAVVVPGMLKLMSEKRGTKEGVPQLILAGSSGDDIYCLVLFTCFASLVKSGSFNPVILLRIPTSIILGVLAGILSGFFLVYFFRRFHPDSEQKIILMLIMSFLFIWIESCMPDTVGFSGLLAIVTMSMVIAKKDAKTSRTLSSNMSVVWKFAQIFLFVLVGAAVDITALEKAGALYALVIAGAMLFRMLGVVIAVWGSSLSRKERLFCMLAYTPKATVQAAIGSIPLSMGLACGNTILSMAVLAIMITAPFGAIAIEKTAPHLLKKE